MACLVDDDWVLVTSSPPQLHSRLTAPSQRRELEWLLNELHETLQVLKSGLQECYALLAPVDPGSTLVVSTPRNEIVKGHVTRVGTRIVKGVRIFPSSFFLIPLPIRQTTDSNSDNRPSSPNSPVSDLHHLPDLAHPSRAPH